MHTCSILALLLLTSTFGQQPRTLEARFIANEAFAISDGSVTLFTDFPYRSGYSVYMTYPTSEIRSATPLSISLITHQHPDHWERSLWEPTGWKVIGPPPVVDGLPAMRRLDPARTGVVGLAIEPIRTVHHDLQHFSYIVTWHGRRLYFTGDADGPEALFAAKNLDVAFVSPWLYRQTAGRGRMLDAKRIVIYHHTATEQVDGCAGNCVVPRSGQTMRF